MATIFTKIINGEIPAQKVAEDDEHIAFLDIRPVKPGHTLVVPKREIDYIFDMSEDELAKLMAFAKKVAGPLEKATNPKRIGIMVAGLEVPHVHIHLIPIDAIADLNFKNARETPHDELARMAEKIRAEFQGG